MRMTLSALLALVTLAAMAAYAQTKVNVSGGDVTSSARRGDAGRLTRRITGSDPQQLERSRVSGDSAQRIAMTDYEWRGRVMSVEFDSADSRVFWDVKIIPDSSTTTIVRYRVDAGGGGILDIREFGGIRGLPRRPRP